MNIFDLLTAQLFAHLLLAVVVAMLAFAAGFRAALVMQRRDFHRSGYTMIGGDLYRAQKVIAPAAQLEEADEA